jgi:hypothetical protein
VPENSDGCSIFRLKRKTRFNFFSAAENSTSEERVFKNEKSQAKNKYRKVKNLHILDVSEPIFWLTKKIRIVAF